MDKEHEEQMINNFRAEIMEKKKEKEREEEEEKQEAAEKEKKDANAEPIEGLPVEVATEATAEVSEETAQTEPVPAKDESIKVEVHATAVHHEVLEPKMAHAQTHEISHSQAVSCI